jgi:hypothetical protein
MAENERKMQADTELWILARQRYCFAASRFVDHETGSSEDTLAVRANDRFVDGFRAPEIVGVYN